MNLPRVLVCFVVAIRAGSVSVAGNTPESAIRSSEPAIHRWGSVTKFHGLPSDHVRAIAQDPDGSLLFGTDEGLARYDGRRVQTLGSGGIAGTRVLSLRADADTVWIGTDTGAALLVAGEIRPIPDTTGHPITAITLRDGRGAVLASELGSLFFCSRREDGSVSSRKLTSEDQSILHVQALGDSANSKPLKLTSIAISTSAVICGSQGRGLLTVSFGEDRRVKEVACHPRPFFVKAMAQDDKLNLWFGAETSRADSGLYDASDLLRPKKIGSVTGTVTALAFDPQNRLWAGTDGSGAYAFQGERQIEHFTFENTAGGLRSNSIHSVFIDREGVVWFGSDSGVSRYDPQAITVEQLSPDPESNVVRALFRSSDGRLWCGTNRGLFVREKDPAWRVVDELKTKTVHSIFEDKSGDLLVGTSSGLFTGQIAKTEKDLRSNNRFVRLVDDPAWNIRAICRFRGTLYVGSFDRGLDRLDGNIRMRVWPSDTSPPPVVSLRAYSDQLLIGTVDRGAFSYDGEIFGRPFGLDALNGLTVASIDGPSASDLWLATSKGLYVCSHGQLTPAIEGTEARSVALGVTERPDFAWCAAATGLYEVKRASLSWCDPTDTASMMNEENRLVVARKDVERGLPSDNCFAVLTSKDNSEIWLGTNRGVVHYRPTVVSPLLRLTRVMAERTHDGQEISAGLTLAYPQSSLTIEVAAQSSRTFPEDFQYWFVVLDQDNRLLVSKVIRDSQLLLQGLRPGVYRTFARVLDGDLQLAEVRFDFAVAGAPFPWTSTALAALLLISLVALVWGWRQNRGLARANQDLAVTRLQLANETETERRRIARDLHDQTLADLRRLMMLTDELPPSTENGHPSVDHASLRHEIESVSTEIRRICEDLSPSALANVGFAAALEWALTDAIAHQPADKRFEYQFSCDEGMDVRLAPTEQIHLYRIVQEALSNICRHANCKKVRLCVRSLGDQVLIEVEDDGRGFDQVHDSASGGRGLTNIRSRANMIGAEVSWRKGAERGTLFILKKSITI